jgi:hypothetical protein
LSDTGSEQSARGAHHRRASLATPPTMPRGSESSYTAKQKRQAEHIEEGYEKRGVKKKTAEARAWATVNKYTGGGKKKKATAKKRSTSAKSKRSGGAKKKRSRAKKSK